MFIITHIAKKPVLFTGFTRNLFYWVNLQFNIIDQERRRQFGPDRTCSEWILRNGGAVKWTHSSEVVSDYNNLPKEGTKVLLQEVDASNSSIMHNGFGHFQGCDQISKLILHKCGYLDDQALPHLHYLKKSLLYLQISSCPNINDNGLLHLKELTKLKQLMLFDLTGVQDITKIVQALKSSLHVCDIQTK